nr:5-oxoprolinase subunit PxpB [Enterobacter sp. Cy-643]
MGEKAVVLELDPPVSLASQQRIWGLLQRLNVSDEVSEAIPGMNNITVVLKDPQRLALDGIEWLQRWWEESEVVIPVPRQIDIPVVYGGEAGPDLDVVARHNTLTPEKVVALHSAAEYVVYFLGFQPGFAYLGGLPEILATPRRAEPRLQVAVGSVGIGGSQTGIYPLVTPGGWQIIGRTSLNLFNPNGASPTLLLPGDTVRFVPQQGGIC